MALHPKRLIEELQVDDTARHLARGGSPDALSRHHLELTKAAHQEGRLSLSANVQSKLYKSAKAIGGALVEETGRAIGNIRQEYERAVWGHPTSYTYGERQPAGHGIHGPPGNVHGPQAPEQPVADPMGRSLGEETASVERQTTAEAYAHLQEVGAERALHDLHVAEGSVYHFGNAPDLENRSSVREEMEARTAGLADAEREKNMRDAYLSLCVPEQEHEGPGGMDR